MLFFDLDGPILDVSDRYYEVYVSSLKEIGGKVLNKNEYWSLKRTKVSDYDILCQTSSEHLLSEFKSRWDFLIEKEELLKLDSVWEELRETYARVCDRIPATLVTLRTYPGRTSWQLNNLYIDSWFSSILSHRSPKVAEERWRAKANLINKSGILKNAGINNCVFIGDTETDILAGRSLSMKVIAVSFGIRAKELLLPLKPDLTFDTPLELSNYLEELYL